MEELEKGLAAKGAAVTYADVFVPLEKLGAPLSFAWGAGTPHNMDYHPTRWP